MDHLEAIRYPFILHLGIIPEDPQSTMKSLSVNNFEFSERKPIADLPRFLSTDLCFDNNGYFRSVSVDILQKMIMKGGIAYPLAFHIMIFMDMKSWLKV